MRSATPIAIAVILASPALAAPLPAEQRLAGLVARATKPLSGGGAHPVAPKPAPESSGSGLGRTALGGFASGAGGAAVNGAFGLIGELFNHGSANSTAKRAVNSLTPDERAAVKNALITKVSSLTNDDLVALQRRAVIAEPRAPKSGGSGLGREVVHGLAEGGGTAVVNNLVGEVEHLFTRTRLHDAIGAPYAVNPIPPYRGVEPVIPTCGGTDPHGIHCGRDEPEQAIHARKVKVGSIVGEVAGSAASGAASSLVDHVLHGIESLFRRDEDNKGLQARKVKIGGIVGDLGGHVVGGAAHGLLEGIENLFRRDEVVSAQFSPTRNPGNVPYHIPPICMGLNCDFQHPDLGGFFGPNHKRAIADLSDAQRQVVKDALINKVSSMSEGDLLKLGRRAGVNVPVYASYAGLAERSESLSFNDLD